MIIAEYYSKYFPDVKNVINKKYRLDNLNIITLSSIMEIRKRVVQPDSNLKIVKILGRKHARQILEVVRDDSKSAKEISELCDIQLVKTYRMLQKLESLKLVSKEGIFNSNKRRIGLYQSRVRSILLGFSEDSQLNMEILGSGKIIQCPNCSSTDGILSIDKNFQMTVVKCNSCEKKYVGILSHKLKEGQQTIIMLEEIVKSKNIS